MLMAATHQTMRGQVKQDLTAIFGVMAHVKEAEMDWLRLEYGKFGIERPKTKLTAEVRECAHHALARTSRR